jgi:hypothetical protein
MSTPSLFSGQYSYTEAIPLLQAQLDNPTAPLSDKEYETALSLGRQDCTPIDARVILLKICAKNCARISVGDTSQANQTLKEIFGSRGFGGLSISLQLEVVSTYLKNHPAPKFASADALVLKKRLHLMYGCHHLLEAAAVRANTPAARKSSEEIMAKAGELVEAYQRGFRLS